MLIIEIIISLFAAVAFMVKLDNKTNRDQINAMRGDGLSEKEIKNIVGYDFYRRFT